MNQLRASRWVGVGVFMVLLALAALCDRTVAAWEPTAPKFLRALGHVFTALGTSGYMFAAAAVVILIALFRLRETRAAGGRREALISQIQRATYFIVVLAISGLLVQAIKHMVGRVRPHAGNADPLQFIPFSAKASFASFPSGHATSAFAAATVLSLMFPRIRWPLFGLATLIAISRVVVGAHFPSDVVCGAALGVTTALALADYRVWQDAVVARVRRKLTASGAGLGGRP